MLTKQIELRVIENAGLISPARLRPACRLPSELEENWISPDCKQLRWNRLKTLSMERPRLMMRPSLLVLLALLVAPSVALAQKKIPKAQGHDQCPLGYVNTLGTSCVSPIYYQVAPTNGEACKEGWMNIGAGYCRKK